MIGISRSGRDRKILAAFASVMAMSASSAAMAECTGTGAAAVFTPLFPFSSGSAVSSLVSAINVANTAFLTQSSAFVSAPGNPRPDQEGGGVWGRAIGGDITTKNTTTTSNVSSGGIAVPGTVTCNSQTNLQFAGVQLGTDVARLNWNGWNVHVGGTAGYLGARARDTSSPGPLNPDGGTFRDTLQVPFAGVYAAVTKGGFFLDGQVRLDYYQNSANDPVVSGLFEQKLDARGVAVTANIGYNQALQNNWFIEPSAGVVASRVKVDPFNITGAFVLPGTFTPNVSVPGVLQINTIQSTLGRLSLRTGTSIASGNMIWQPFVIGSVYHEFERNTTATFGDIPYTAIVGLPPFSGNISTTQIGTYGQVGVGLAAQVTGTGLLGYVRGDYRFGDRIEGYSINGGVRYQFTPETVNAPMYAKAPILKSPMLAQAYNWTGWFIGASGGIHNGDTRWTFGNGASTNPRFAGGLAGIQAGYDWQFGRWVVGVEGNINSTNANGARACPFAGPFNCENSSSYVGTATARLGYALTDRSLWYVRGGGAFDNTRITGKCNTGPFQPIFGPLLAGCGESDRRNRQGYTIGFGSEFALTQNWTARSETNFYDMGTRAYFLPSVGAVDVRERGFVSTVGVNYRFGGPVVARY